MQDNDRSVFDQRNSPEAFTDEYPQSAQDSARLPRGSAVQRVMKSEPAAGASRALRDTAFGAKTGTYVFTRQWWRHVKSMTLLRME